MMSPIGLYLPEFTCRTAAGSFGVLDVTSLEHVGEVDVGPEEDLPFQLEQARREGFEDGAASAQEALVEQAVALGSQYAEQLEAERRRWAESEGAVLAEALQGQLARLEDSLAAALADVLQPFLIREARLKAVAELREAIASLRANGTGGVIRVVGPADLIAGLASIGGVETEAADTPEVTLLAGDTFIRSKLLSWAAALAPSGEAQP